MEQISRIRQEEREIIQKFLTIDEWKRTNLGCFCDACLSTGRDEARARCSLCGRNGGINNES